MERFPCACCGGEDFNQIDDGMFECVSCGTIFFARETDGFEVHLVNGNTPAPVENEVVVAYDDTDDDYDSEAFSEDELDDPVELQLISARVGNELDWDDADAIRSLLMEGRTLEAIKKFRELCGCGLKEAKDSIDEYRGAGEYAPDDEDDDYEDDDDETEGDTFEIAGYIIDDPTAERIYNSLKAGGRLNAIKIFREATGCDLVTGKNAIDEFIDLFEVDVPAPASYDNSSYSSSSSGDNVSNAVKEQLDQLKSAADQVKGGCYVATCVYGSYDCPQVWTLRRYRDYCLNASWYGRLFIKAYYAVSPTIVKWFGETKWFKKLWKGRLDKMVRKLQAQGVTDTPYQDLY